MRAHGTLAWLALHPITLLGGRNQFTALVNLSWRYLPGGTAAASSATTGGQADPLNRPVDPSADRLRGHRSADSGTIPGLTRVSGNSRLRDYSRERRKGSSDITPVTDSLREVPTPYMHPVDERVIGRARPSIRTARLS